MSDFQITSKIIGDKALAQWFDQLSDEVGEQALVNAGLAGALPVVNAAKGKAPKKTRTLSRSIHEEVGQRSPTYVEIGIGTDLEYAAIQEFGGTITPKKGKYLAIPQTEAAEQYVSPRNFPGKLEPRIGKSGSGALFDEAGVAQYLLVKSVTIPAHPYLRPAIDENGEQAVSEMGRVLKQQMDRIAPE